MKTAKNGGFCEELLSENYFETISVVMNMVPMLLRQFRTKDYHKGTAGVMPTHLNS